MRSLKKFQSDSGVAAHPGVGGNYGVCCLGCVSALLGRYDAAHDLMRGKKYQEADDAFSSLGNYKDGPLQLRQANYWGRFESASDMLAAGKLDAAKEVFRSLANSENFSGRQEALEELGRIDKLQTDVDKNKSNYEELTRLKFWPCMGSQ